MRTCLRQFGILAVLSLALAGGSAVAEDRALRSVPVGAFKQIEVTGMASVVLVQGEREEMTVEAPSGTHARIRVENENGVLGIAVRDEAAGMKIFHGGSQPPKITVTFRNLEALRIAGVAKVEAAKIVVPSLEIEATGATKVNIGSLETATLHVQGAGALKAEIAGRATTQHVEMSGAGEYRAGDLASDSATVEVSGAGRVLVRVEKQLDVQASGAGIVEYIGNPKVTQDVSGAGRVRRRERVTSLDSVQPLPEG